MNKQLRKAINLAKKTGDRLIVYDSSNQEDTFVVMLLDEYEKMVTTRSEVRGLTEDELLDKINRDIAIWKSEQVFNVSGKSINESKEQFLADISSIRQSPLMTETEIMDQAPVEPGEKKKNHWKIPLDRKEAAEEIIEEDRQYLEDVNY